MQPRARMAAMLGALLPAVLAAQGAPRPGVDPGPWDNDVYLPPPPLR